MSVEERKLKKRKNRMFVFLLILFVVSTFYAIYMLFHAPLNAATKYDRIKSDYVLMILQCIGGAIVIFLPAKVEEHFDLHIPDQMEILYFLFLFCAIFLGEVQNFYYKIPFWDMILHGFSAAMIGALGFIIVRYLNDSEKLDLALSPFFVAMFAFCFAMTCGTIWEIYEFTADALLGTNMQKFITAENEVLVGHAALVDTMKDIIVNTVGALFTTTLGYFTLKKKETVDITKVVE